MGNKIKSVSDSHDIQYTFRLLNDPAINALSGPGGFIYINTGLLNVDETDDELAAVMAHEKIKVDGFVKTIFY